MKKKSFLFNLLIIALMLTASISKNAAQAQNALKKGQDGDYAYEYAENDPLHARIYTLKNGLKVYLSPNKREPRIYTAIPVRVGSKSDPRDNTGLAHYLEHMVFKGTSKIGTQNWEKEKGYLQQISDLYEKHKATADPATRSKIYKQIDSLSLLAAQYAVPNEYDKMTTSLGAQGTNAFTSTDQTVYINDIPANELERWAMLEAERFSELVLRLFHTELETVYEEFNMGQDRDQTKSYNAMMSALFPTHPYNITTIGLGQHLKNPSHEAIHKFWETYYVPNNMAVCMSGDFEFSPTIRIIDKYFGQLQYKKLPANEAFPHEADMKSPIEKTVYGKEAENIIIAFRLEGAKSRDAQILRLLDGVLQNGTAGIMDINLIQKQKILSGGNYSSIMSDYSTYVLNARPREGQSLEEVKQLLLDQIQQLKDGNFGDWLLPASIKNFKLNEMKNQENNSGRTFQMVDAFIEDKNWDDTRKELAELEKITKQDIINFAREKFSNNYVVVYKKQGEDPDIMKIEKPAISEMPVNREAQSEFIKKFESMPESRLKPVFLDFNKDIQKSTLKNGIAYYYTKNDMNPIFDLYYILDMGTQHNKKLGMAVRYLKYIGTDKYSAAQLKEEFYKLGLSFDVSTATDRVYVSLSGLEESLDAGIKLFEHILANARADEQALNDLKEGVLKERENARKDKRMISNALMSYATYGPNSEYKYVLSNDEIKKLNAQELIDLLKSLTTYKHYIFYYGQKEAAAAQKVLEKYHKVAKKLKDYPPQATFVEQPTDKDQVLFVNYDMVQAQISMLSKDTRFDKSIVPASNLFGEYFGGSMSSIVFQEIREARALAYSAWAGYTTPSQADRSHYTRAFMAVQADKLKDAVTAMRSLLNNMPTSELSFSNSRNAIMKGIETERINGDDKFFTFLRARKQGLDYDIRKDIYACADKCSMDEIQRFFDSHVRNRNYTFVVMGSNSKLDMDYLRSIGTFKEVTLDDIFGY